MTPQYRSPEGRFIAPGEALTCWLPVMLKASYFDPIEQMLRISAGWCLRNGAQRFEIGAQVLENRSSDGIGFPVRCANKWQRKAELLIKAMADLKEIENGF